MKNRLSDCRLAVLRDQSNCPACGSDLWMHSGHADHFMTMFRCGAIFDVRKGHPVKHLTPCPGPSAVAAALLDRQAAAIAEALQPL